MIHLPILEWFPENILLHLRFYCPSCEIPYRDEVRLMCKGDAVFSSHLYRVSWWFLKWKKYKTKVTFIGFPLSAGWHFCWPRTSVLFISWISILLNWYTSRPFSKGQKSYGRRPMFLLCKTQSSVLRIPEIDVVSSNWIARIKFQALTNFGKVSLTHCEMDFTIIALDDWLISHKTRLVRSQKNTQCSCHSFHPSDADWFSPSQYLIPLIKFKGSIYLPEFLVMWYFIPGKSIKDYNLSCFLMILYPESSFDKGTNIHTALGLSTIHCDAFVSQWTIGKIIPTPNQSLLRHFILGKHYNPP